MPHRLSHHRLQYDVFMVGPWTKISVILAVLGSIVSIVSLAYQIRRSRFVHSIDLLLKFEDNFFGPEKREVRSRAARGMLRETPDYSEAEDILDFFETVALLVRKGALDGYMVWHTFDYWISRYYEAAKPHIVLRQKSEPQVWLDLGDLVQKLREREMKASRLSSISQTVPDNAEIRRFLEEELHEGKPRDRSFSGV
jgi:hypothetical protein